MTNKEKMTSEEAHRILSNGLVNAPSEHEWCMAYEMAIKALSQEPCDDVISRQYLLDNCVVDKATMPYVPVNKIKNAPPVTQKPIECDDAVSKQHIIDTYKSCADMLSDEELKGADLVMEWVNNAPPVTQNPIECDDAISRDAVMRLIENKPYDWSNLTERHNMLMEIRKLPSVTPKQKSGKWIPTNDISKWGYKCSECEGIDDTYLGHFCKWCGAKMESEVRNENV